MASDELARLKSELTSLWRGAWDAIHDLEDRVLELERTVRAARVDFHPRDYHVPPFNEFDEDD